MTLVRRVIFVSLFGVFAGACVPQTYVNGVETKIERTTVTVRDPEGKILRTEEKEMVLQSYIAGEPVKLKTATAPRLPRQPGEPAPSAQPPAPSATPAGSAPQTSMAQSEK